MATNKILPSSNHAFEMECKEIHDSCGRLNALTLQSLASRNEVEKKKIKETYNVLYKEDLLKRLVKNKGLFMWMLDSHDRDAITIRGSLDNGDSRALKRVVEIFVGRKSSHVEFIKQVYQERYKRRLDQDILNIEPPHPYQKILVALGASHKAHHEDVSQHIAKCDAMRLYENGEGRIGGIEEAVVLEIFSKRSIPQLNLTFFSYKHIYGHSYTKSVKKGNREFEDALKMVIKCMCNPPKYYAKALYASIKERIVERERLEHIIVARSNIDMVDIQTFFKTKYGMKLRDAISETMPIGENTDFLLALTSKCT